MPEQRTNEWPIRPSLYCIADHKHRIVNHSLEADKELMSQCLIMRCC